MTAEQPHIDCSADIVCQLEDWNHYNQVAWNDEKKAVESSNDLRHWNHYYHQTKIEDKGSEFVVLLVDYQTITIPRFEDETIELDGESKRENIRTLIKDVLKEALLIVSSMKFIW
jgi:hypothetical protein